MDNKGLTLSFIFEGESANYGEGYGNVGILKKLTRGDGKQYSYISRQALRYSIVNQLGWNITPVGSEKAGKGSKDENNEEVKVSKSGVVQFSASANIDKYAEIDLFGYMKTKSKDKNDGKGSSSTRAAVARLSHAISLEPYNSDMDFLTNIGLASRLNGVDNSIAQSEVHKSYYAYSITIDLDAVGIDGEIEIDKPLRAQRVKDLLRTIKALYRDIRGRRENLSPIFVVGGIYDIKVPYFENRLKVKSNKLDAELIAQVIEQAGNDSTQVGVLKGVFDNDSEISKVLNPASINEVFDNIYNKVDSYYA